MTKIAKRVRGAVLQPNVIAIGKLVALLYDGKMDRHQLAAATGLSVCTVEKYIRAIKQAGCAYIAERRMDPRGGFTVKVHKLGREDDVEPVKRPHTLRQRERRNGERIRRVPVPVVPLSY